MRLSDKQIQFGGMVGKLLVFAAAQGIPAKVTELYRSQEVQERLFARGLSRTRRSKHAVGLAVDLAVIRAGKLVPSGEDYERLGAFWKSIGGRWGGDFATLKDLGHFEWAGEA